MTHKNMNVKEAKIELREEELELIKRRVQAGEVRIRKEILREEKNITVPVAREELVIEKRESVENASGGNETIRIPISEEHIDVIKYPILLEDVSIYKNNIQDLQHIEETLKREKLCVKATGDVNVIENGIEK